MPRTETYMIVGDVLVLAITLAGDRSMLTRINNNQ
jgi:hypothetical protein